MTTGFAHHWQLMLAAAVTGLVLGVALVAVTCLATPMRSRLTADPESRAHVLREEIRRLRRLGDAAAVLDEHGRCGVGELRGEAELRALLLRRVLHRTRSGRRR